MDLETPRHTDFQPLAAWARLLTWGAVASGVWAAIRNPPGDGFSSSVIAAAILSLGILVELVFGGVKIELFSDRLRVSLGRIGWIKKTVPYETVERIEPVTDRPLREFGGWGVRGFGTKQAWTAQGNRALVLHRVGGSLLYLGCEDPERLAERLRSAAGQRFANH